MTHPTFPPLWPPQAGEIWQNPLNSPRASQETTFWLAFWEEIALDAVTGVTSTRLMMINGWGDILTPDDLLAEWRQLDLCALPALVIGTRTTVPPPPVESAELREHGAERLLASVGTRGGRRG